MKAGFTKINGASVLAAVLAMYFLQDGLLNGILNHRSSLISASESAVPLSPATQYVVPLVDILLGIGLLYGAILNFQRGNRDD